MIRSKQRAAVTATGLVLVLIASPVSTAEAAAPDGNPFGPQSFWRTPLATAPIDADSQAMVDHLVGTVTDRYGGIAAFNAHQYDSALYTVDATTPTADVAYDDCQRKGKVPAGLTGPGGVFTAVPIPAGAVAATGTDAELSVHSTATDQLWEFWRAKQRADGSWSACWGGRIDHVSTSDGAFPGTFGATATGLPNAGGLVRFSEIQTGRIEHLMSLAIPSPAVWSRYRWPARRSDGSDTDPAALPEGSRLRLDPSVDVTRLGLTAAGVVIARAAQQYGFVVVDRSGAVSVLAEAKPTAAGSADPWRALLGGPDYAVLKDFPWSRLQVVADGWRGPVATSATTTAATGATTSEATPTGTPAAAAGPSSSGGTTSTTTPPAAPSAQDAAKEPPPAVKKSPTKKSGKKRTKKQKHRKKAPKAHGKAAKKKGSKTRSR